MLNVIISLNPKNCHAVENALPFVAYILMSFSIEKYVHFLLFDRELESEMFWVISVWESHQCCSTDQLHIIHSLLTHLNLIYCQKLQTSWCQYHKYDSLITW